MLIQKSKIGKIMARTKVLFFLPNCLVFPQFQIIKCLTHESFFPFFFFFETRNHHKWLLNSSFSALTLFHSRYYRISGIFHIFSQVRAQPSTYIAKLSREKSRVMQTKFFLKDKDFSLKEVLKFSPKKNQTLDSHYSVYICI